MNKLLTVVVLSLALGAVAQAKNVCGGDVKNFCATSKTKKAVHKCLVKHKDELSTACAAKINKHHKKSNPGAGSTEPAT